MTTRGLMGWSSWRKFERNLQEDFAQASAMPPIPQLAQIFATCISPIVMTVFVDFLKWQFLHHSTMQQGRTFLEGGVCHGQNGSQNFRFYKCYDICFYNFCDKHPLIRKNRF